MGTEHTGSECMGLPLRSAGVAKHQGQQVHLLGLMPYFVVLELVCIANEVIRGSASGHVSLSVRS